MFRSGATAVTLKDLRIAKLSKQYKPLPCAQLLESYMNAMQDLDKDDSQVSVRIRILLHRCLEDKDVSHICGTYKILFAHQ